MGDLPTTGAPFARPPLNCEIGREWSRNDNTGNGDNEQQLSLRVGTMSRPRRFAPSRHPSCFPVSDPPPTDGRVAGREPDRIVADFSSALQLEPGISLILVRSDKGYCFSSWSRHDGGLMSKVSEAHRLRAFSDPDEAAKFFASLIGLDAAR